MGQGTREHKRSLLCASFDCQHSERWDGWLSNAEAQGEYGYGQPFENRPEGLRGPDVEKAQDEWRMET